MITPHDIEKVVKNALAAQTILTGGCHPNQAPDDPGYPYAVFIVDGETPEYTSGPQYFQAWSVRTEAYAVLGSTTILDLQKALMSALALDGAPVVTNLRGTGESVLQSTVEDNTEDYDDTLRDGKNVISCTLSVRLLAQGNRSVA